MNIGVTRKLTTEHTTLLVDPATDHVVFTQKNEGVADQNGRMIPPRDYVLLRGDGVLHFGHVRETNSPITGKQLEATINQKGRFSFGKHDFFHNFDQAEGAEHVISPKPDPESPYTFMNWQGHKPFFHYEKRGTAASYITRGKQPGTLDWVQVTRHESGTHIGIKPPELN